MRLERMKGYDRIMDQLDSLEKLLDPSSPSSVVWAKTNMRDPSDLRWLALPQHAADTMLTAGKIWDEFLAEHVKTLLAEAFEGEDAARRVTSFIAGCHDVGKATPAFEKQARGETGERRLNALEAAGLTIPDTVVKPSELRHEISGYWAMMEWLQTTLGLSSDDASRLAIVIGGHHGVFHDEKTYGSTNKAAKADYYGAGPWAAARRSLIDAVDGCVDASSVLAHLDFSKVTQYVQSLMSGIITMADWIASDSWNFRLTSEGMVPAAHAVERVERAWWNLALPTERQLKSWGASFAEMFDLPEGSKPNAMQRLAKDLAAGAGSPCLMLIEAPMGSGKTEAALSAAMELASKNHANGVAFALPTQATADGILPRVARWAAGSIDDDAAIRLMHGRAAMNDDYAAMRVDGVYDDSGDDARGGGQPKLTVNKWFDGSKQGLLANFVVCTIDQILMAALQAKHYDLRHLGLAGKVVIVDEVHAADDYMERYLERAVEWLASMDCPVIMLSATLPENRRAGLLKAYRIGTSRLDESGLRRLDLKPDGWDECRLAYPLISVADADHGALHPVPMGDDGHDGSKIVTVEHLMGADWRQDLKRRLTGGGNAVVIRNTVRRAQQTYMDLLDDPFFDDCELTLLHAKFLPGDRKANEDRLRRWYGRRATLENGERPARSVVVATQVVEQSLDVDFDYMITDVCPMDLLLQRVGRLHRHERHGRPEAVADPVVSVDDWWTDDAGMVRLGGGSKTVYGESKLLRTIALTGGCCEQSGSGEAQGEGKPFDVEIPRDLPVLVQSAYDLKHVPKQADPGLTKAIEKADVKAAEKSDLARRKALTFLLRPPARGGEGHRVWTDLESSNSMGSVISNDLKAKAQVRDSDSGLSVLLLRQVGDGYAAFLEDDLADGQCIPLEGSLDDELGLLVARQTISLPAALANAGTIDSMIAWLEANAFVPAWQSNRWVAGEFVLLLDETGSLELTLGASGDRKEKTFQITYDSVVGLVCEKMEA